MARNIALQVFSREIVKPSSSGSNHPKTHNLSFFDSIALRTYVPIVYFYANANGLKTDETTTSEVLKKSLAAALSLYYPLAGRSNSDDVTIDCNDEGVLFLEARIGCNLSEALSDLEDTVNLLFPDGLHYKYRNSGGLLVVQVTYFDCGGIAIGICVCHSIMDMSSICCFVNNWASLANSCDPEVVANPEFNFGTLYPLNDLPEIKVSVDNLMQAKCVLRSFVFDNAKIAKLKAMVKKEVVENPTRMEVVTALIFKCAVSAAARARSSSSGHKKPAKIHLPVNLRSRVSPRFSVRDIGNFAGSIWVQLSREETENLEWDQIVGKIRNEKSKYFNECAQSSTGESLRNFISEGTNWMKKISHDEDIYFLSNWCGFPFYEADFGWGKPASVSSARMAMKNWIQMTDTREGGIEVLVNLEEKDMAISEFDEEILAYVAV